MHMTKYVALCGIVSALVWAGVAAAATPQGQLTGTAAFGCCTIPGISVTTTVIDGGTSSVGLENDRSGNCAGDSGVVQGPGPGGSDISHTIRCAHYVASSRDGSGPKMRFAYTFFEPAGNFYSVVVYRISDGGPGARTRLVLASRPPSTSLPRDYWPKSGSTWAKSGPAT